MRMSVCVAVIVNEHIIVIVGVPVSVCGDGVVCYVRWCVLRCSHVQ